MLVYAFLGLVLVFGSGLGIILGMAWLWKKMKLKPVAGGTLGFFLSCIVCMFIYIAPSKAYVVTGEKEYSAYWVYGDAVYTMSDGTEVPLSSANGATLINDSEHNIIMQQVVYGYGKFPAASRVIPGQVFPTGYSEIAYFFDEEPDETASSESASGYVTKLQVIMEDDFEFILKEDLEKIREKLEE